MHKWWYTALKTSRVDSPIHRVSSRRSSLLLRCSLGLGGLLLVAVDHHNPDKCAHHGRTQQREDNRDTDGPDARGEEIVERMARVDKGLEYISILYEIHTRVERNTIRRVHVV